MGADQADFDGLLILLKASSKKSVNELCNRTVSSMYEANQDDQLAFIRTHFSTEHSEAEKLLSSVRDILHRAIYLGCRDPSSIRDLFPSDFHPNLQDLLVKIIIENQPSWRRLAVDNQVSFPKLTEFSWKIREDRNMAPSCVVDFITSPHSSSSVEMSSSTLDTMLDSLSKIRDQISSIAQ